MIKRPADNLIAAPVTLGRAIQVPDGRAYQYVTATLDLSIAPDHNNLLVCDEHGELVTTARLAGPRR